MTGTPDSERNVRDRLAQDAVVQFVAAEDDQRMRFGKERTGVRQ